MNGVDFDILSNEPPLGIWTLKNWFVCIPIPPKKAKAVLKCLPPFKKMKVIFLKAKSVTVTLYTLTRW